jgi:uncharacterized membrane protein
LKLAKEVRVPPPVADSVDAITKKNVEDIARLEKQAVQDRTRGECLAESITRMAGSMPVIVFHAVWFSVWALLNLGVIPNILPWDPLPFNFLTLILSLEAIFLTLLVLTTQNRLTKDADKRAHLELQINMLAEQESTATLRMLEKICKHLGIEYEAEEAQQLAKTTDVIKIAKSLEKLAEKKKEN